MKKKIDGVLFPTSYFIKVECECGNTQVIFSNPTTTIVCKKCGKVLAKPTGGKGRLSSGVKVIKEYRLV